MTASAGTAAPAHGANSGQVKQALIARAEGFARFLFPAGKKMGREWKVGSICGEAGESLGICIEGAKAGVFCDFATGDSGDNLVELYAQAKRCEFREALRACAEWLGVTVTPGTKPTAAASTDAITQSGRFPEDSDLMSNAECRQAVHMVSVLRDDLALCQRIANARGWRVDTIQRLTHEPSLGWHDGKLAFVYETGVKVRWREKGERVIRWAFGRPWIWRAPQLLISDTVYLCEGETDAISLIDAGLEDQHATGVVAIPSASGFDARWVQSFRSKEVILVLDADKAGTEATAKISSLLRGCVRSLKQLDWRAVQYASAS